MGPVISKAAKEVIEAQVRDALAKGAVDVTPDNCSFKMPPDDGNYVVPRILKDVSHKMLVMQDETFGPIIPVAKVANDEEAIRLMNDSQYGLTASVWTRDIATGEKLIEQLEAGTVFINRADYPSPVSPSFFVTALRSSHVPLISYVVADLAFIAGFGLDWLEVVWTGMYVGPEGFRCLLQIAELPHQGTTNLMGRCLVVHECIDDLRHYNAEEISSCHSPKLSYFLVKRSRLLPQCQKIARKQLSI